MQLQSIPVRGQREKTVGSTRALTNELSHVSFSLTYSAVKEDHQESKANEYNQRHKKNSPHHSEVVLEGKFNKKMNLCKTSFSCGLFP